jgi:CxxC motif-containing protein (DUF1111 family)
MRTTTILVALGLSAVLPGTHGTLTGQSDAGTKRAEDAAALVADDVPGRVPLGGPATVDDASPNAFGFPARVLDRVERRAFAVGNSFFKDNWVEAPASATGRDGLGPFFNARSCSACHFKDGRGRAPSEADGDAVTGFLIRLGMPGERGDVPHPIYGGQLQDRTIAGRPAEAAFRIEHERVAGHYGDGTPYELLRPRYVLHTPAHGSLDLGTLRIGPRVAQQVIGLGLLEAVPEQTLRGLADPDDRDGDGVSGRVHVVTRPDGSRAVGRFGWKATQATVRDQSAAAFAGDIGITSSAFPRDDVTEAQIEQLDADWIERVRGGNPELDDHKLDRVAFYTATLAVPAQRAADDPLVRRGEELFEAMRCASCHVPVLRTGPDAIVPAYANVAFRPYTDLLLHDLGPDLADDKQDGNAAPSEWRTPPLWGIGLFATVNEHTRYLHDGRARDLAEAVLWHGGEAEDARAAFVAADAADREALLAFLRSL